MPRNEMALRILTAAEVLMAEEGVQMLSTHKIAKVAKLSVGTIYLHFKDKDDLLTQLVSFLFERFHQAILPNFDAKLPLDEQYRVLWWAKWQFLQANPTVVKNIHQYESLPQFQSLLKESFINQDIAWNRFVTKAKAAGKIVDLPSNVLYAMTMKTTRDLAYLQIIEQKPFSDAVLEEVILRTWKAIIL